jgi:hypothetical protein
MKALSIRQPWAWLIVYGPKTIENRCWFCHYRGRLLIHASGGMTQREYVEAAAYAHARGVIVPDRAKLEFGGVIGVATVTGCVAQSVDPWFMGPYGITLADRQPLPCLKVKGRLGLFEVAYPVGDFLKPEPAPHHAGLFAKDGHNGRNP